MGEVPQFAALAALQSGQHQLRPHRAIADKPALSHRLMKQFLHGHQRIISRQLTSTEQGQPQCR
jgi:hypothetical protein